MKKLLPLIVAALLGSMPPAHAQTWSGLGADGNWSTPANWVGGLPPLRSTSTSLTFGATGARLVANADGLWTVNRIALGGASYTLSGGPIALGGAGPSLSAVDVPHVVTATLIIPNNTSMFVGSSLLLQGGLDGTNQVAKGGPGVVTIQGVDRCGGWLVGDGTVVVRGTVFGAMHFSGGTLAGDGTIAALVDIGPAATLSPGLSPGQINTGNLTLAGTALFEIEGPMLATQYDNINVTGTVDVTGGTLQLAGAYVPVPGDSFVLISNDGTDPVVGTFAGLPEGAIVTFNGVPLRLSYAGGTGNDVVLAVPVAGPVPTLSETALFMLAALLAMAAARALRRRDA